MVGREDAAEDLTQDTFRKLFDALDCYDTDQPFGRWIRTIARNGLRKYVVRKRPDAQHAAGNVSPGYLDWAELHVSDPTDAEAADWDPREFEFGLDKALRQLRPEYRKCWILRHRKGHSPREIAYMTDLPAQRGG